MAIAHDMEVKAALRAYRKALDALQRPDKAPRQLRNALLAAQEAGASKAELARALGDSRQRVDEVPGRARHERAAGVEDVTDWARQALKRTRETLVALAPDA